MNSEMKKNLEAVVVAVANEDTDAAKKAFHDYLRQKTQSILLGEEEDKEDKKVDKDVEKLEKDVEKTKKDQDEDDEKEEKEEKDEDEDKDEKVEEAWEHDVKVNPAEKGKYKDWSVERLEKRHAELKKSGPHKRGSKEYGEEKELEFAIRGKKAHGNKKSWGKA